MGVKENKNKNEEKKGKEKENALAAYGWWYGGRCSKYGKYGHNATDSKCPENK